MLCQDSEKRATITGIAGIASIAAVGTAVLRARVLFTAAACGLLLVYGAALGQGAGEDGHAVLESADGLRHPFVLGQELGQSLGRDLLQLAVELLILER